MNHVISETQLVTLPCFHWQARVLIGVERGLILPEDLVIADGVGASQARNCLVHEKTNSAHWKNVTVKIRQGKSTRECAGSEVVSR